MIIWGQKSAPWEWTEGQEILEVVTWDTSGEPTQTRQDFATTPLHPKNLHLHNLMVVPEGTGSVASWPKGGKSDQKRK